MSLFNPITLLQLNYYEYQRLDAATIHRAADQLREQIAAGKSPQYEGQAVTEEMVKEAETLLEETSNRAFYYQLAKYPGLSAFLEGDEHAEVEADSLRLHAEQLEERAANMLAPLAGRIVEEALEAEKTKRLQAFKQQIEKGSREFQRKVFAPGVHLLQDRRGAIAQMLRELESGDFPLQKLRGLGLLREQIPVPVINALPFPFAEERNEIRRLLGRIARELSAPDPALALACIEYALRIEGEAAYTGKLEQAKAQLQDKFQEESKKRGGRLVTVGLIGGSIALLLLLLAGYYGWNRYNQFMSEEPGMEDTDIFEPQTAEEEEAPGQETAYLHLPWWERGYEAPGDGMVELGSAPLSPCFPTVRTKGRAQTITVIGDPAYDALVFFFNGRDYFKQAYIPAKSRYVIRHPLSSDKVSTMLVFGQNWNEEKTSPCGTQGYFEDNIFYGGFTSYATDPPYLSLEIEDALFLKKRRLMPAREMKADGFFEVLEQYR